MLGRYGTHRRLLASVALAVTVAAFPATSFATTLDDALADDYADVRKVCTTIGIPYSSSISFPTLTKSLASR